MICEFEAEVPGKAPDIVEVVGARAGGPALYGSAVLRHLLTDGPEFLADQHFRRVDVYRVAIEVVFGAGFAIFVTTYIDGKGTILI
jgi:hypothetical protein